MLLSLLALISAMFGYRWLAAMRVAANRSQPPHNIGSHANMDGLHELSSKGMMFLAPATGEVDTNIVSALRAVDNLDIFGAYLPTNKSVNGAPVYAKQQYLDSFDEEDHELNMWHFSEAKQWYVGPRDRVGSSYGVVKAQVQRWGAGGIPHVPTKGWEVHDGSNWLQSGVQCLSPA